MIISKFREKPRTKDGWRTLWLGSIAFLTPFVLSLYAAVISPILSRVSGVRLIPSGFLLAVGMFAIAIAALVFGIRALRSGERSWAVFLGFVFAVLVVLFWAMMFVGELLFPH